MSTIKTAISIEKDLFDEVESFARRLHLSRSQVFAQAVQNLVAKKRNLELLTRLNQAYAVPQNEELARTKLQKPIQTRLARGTW
jgi:metal-responsive CopG/Arc/MetJ family transcriptional regulator